MSTIPNPSEANKPRKRFFPPVGGELSSPNESDTVATEPAALAPASQLEATTASRKRPGPKPTAESSQRVLWAYRALPKHKREVEKMLSVAPRHINLQDLLDYIMADFLARNQELPESLRTSLPPA